MYSYQAEQDIESAARILMHYIQVASEGRKVGDDPDHYAEIRCVVELIVDAAVATMKEPQDG